jgi:hypothetical protein
MASVATAAPATAAPKLKGPEAINPFLPTMNEGTSRLQMVNFRTDVRVCDVKLIVTPWGGALDVTYPDGPQGQQRPFTLLNGNRQLDRREVDFAAFRVTVNNVSRSGWVILPAKVYYNYCGAKGKPRGLQVKEIGFVQPVRAR